MKRRGKMASGKQVIALALTWDGARWPKRALPVKARHFLAGKTGEITFPTKNIAQLFVDDLVSEMRICWVPRLVGGDDVLSAPFKALSGKRTAFAATKKINLGDVLGVVYRRR